MNPQDPYCEWPEGCTSHKENNRLPYCGTHNHEQRRIDSQGSRQKKVYVIPKRSAKGIKREAEKQKVYKTMTVTEMVCSACGTTHSLTPSHILPQGQYGAFAADSRNVVWDCIECHTKWEHGNLSQCEELSNWPQRLDIIEELSPIYFFRRFGLILAEYRRKKNI